MSNRKQTVRLTPVAGGGSDSVNIDTGVEVVYIAPSAGITLAAPYNVTVSGTARLHQQIRFVYGGLITTSSPNVVNIFGTALSDAQALYEGEITAFYNGSSWDVRIFPDDQTSNKNQNGANIVDGSIPTAALADNAITNDKLNDIPRGYVKVGGTGNAPTDLDAKTSGAVLIGDGTDVVSKVVSGHIAIDPATGSATIQSNVITTAMLNFTISDTLETTITLDTTLVKDLASAVGGTPQVVIAAPGANKLIEVVSASTFLDYNSATYAAGGNLLLNYDGAAGTSIATLTSTAVTGAVDTIGRFNIATGIWTTAINQPVYIENASANFTTGDSPLTISIRYRIIDFS